MTARDGKRLFFLGESQGLCVASQESLSQVGLLDLSVKSLPSFLGLPQKSVLGFLGLTHFLQSSSVSQVFQEM